MMSPKIGLLAQKHNCLPQKGNFWQSGPKKACSVASRAKLSTQKVPIYLISTTFGDEITFEHITRRQGADFDKTHFFQRRPVYMLVFQRSFTYRLCTNCMFVPIIL